MRCIEIVFSPTGGTRKVADRAAAALGEVVEVVDLADARADFSAVSTEGAEVALVAMPCFGGRVPRVAMERLGRIAGAGVPCVVVNVYGNRAFDDALLEMADGAAAAGFSVVAALAAVAEHSIMHQYAAGRPDASDNARIAELIGAVRSALDEGRAVEAPPVPGKQPYVKEGAVPLAPKYAGSCRRCGRCVEACPVEAVDATALKTDKGACIACMGCVAVCPDRARTVNGLLVKAAALAIKKQEEGRKEAELFSVAGVGIPSRP